VKYTKCQYCDNSTIPVNNTKKVDGKVCCSECFDIHYSYREQKEGKIIEKQFDPTICFVCGKDNGDTSLSKLSYYAICDTCNTELKARIFPNWVKGFFAAIILLVIFSSAWNWRFFQSYKNLKSSNAAFSTGNYEKASTLMKKASEQVPEVEDLKTLYFYFNGIDLLSKDKGYAALKEFNKCKDKIPEDYPIDRLIIEAKLGASFDQHDYMGFLSSAQEYLEIDSTNAMSWATVASAYACLYATKKNDSLKTLCIQHLNKAQTIDSASHDMIDYYKMISYRMDSKEILTRAEYQKKFPGGYSKN
jgi:tetratricopeptide (TPR) repeat protein